MAKKTLALKHLVLLPAVLPGNLEKVFFKRRPCGGVISHPVGYIADVAAELVGDLGVRAASLPVQRRCALLKLGDEFRLRMLYVLLRPHFRASC